MLSWRSCPPTAGLDGELVVWQAGRPTFERFQQRLARRDAGALAAARARPAPYVVFDLLRLRGTGLTVWTSARRRVLGDLFTEAGLDWPAHVGSVHHRSVRHA